MRRLHVYRLVDGQLAPDVQSDYVDTGSRIVVPLVPVGDGSPVLPRLHPSVTVEGERYRLRTEALGAVEKPRIRPGALADISDQHDAVRDALDFLFLGF